MSFDKEMPQLALQVANVGKAYRIYNKNTHRLYQFFLPKKVKLYSEFWAVKNVSFQINKGETVAILGRNGAGKSTLLQLISNTLSPTTGEIYRKGKIAALLELGAGFNNEFTGRENIYISGAIYGLSRTEIDAKFTDIESFADIGTFIDQPVKNYSSGMFVRLAFALIVNVDAEILIIDEALAVGDVFFQQKCMRFLRGFQDNGGTILFVSHDTAAVMALCDKAILLRRNASGDTYVTEGKAETVCHEYLKELYADPERLKNNSQTSKIKSHTHAKIIEGDSISPSLYFVSDFNSAAESFGRGGGSIKHAEVQDPDGSRVKNISSGQEIKICISIEAESYIENPAVGLILKDSKGQFLFTESTDPHFRLASLSMNEGEKVNVYFTLKMPVLIRGVYSIDFAFANGVGDDHYQLHWIHDAVVIECVSGRHVHGILGFDNLDIKWESK